VAPALEPASASSSRPSLRIRQPVDGDRFQLDLARPGSAQRVWLHADLPARGPRPAMVEWRVSGEVVARVGPPYSARWLLRPGRHRVEARAPNLGADEVTIVVR
jgi:hypothetical protein